MDPLQATAGDHRRRARATSQPLAPGLTDRDQLLTEEDVRILLAGIDTATTAGLHDRAMLGVMLYCFVRPGRCSSCA